MLPDIPDLIERFGERIGRAALMLCGNPWDADDLRQETFLIAAQSASRYQGRSQVYTWLYGILLNVDRRRRRKQDIRRRALAAWLERQPAEPPRSPAADAALLAREWKRGLWSRVHELPDGQRQCLVLRFSEGLKYDEIAEIVQCPPGTVKSRVYHGLAALRAMLEQEGDPWRAPPRHSPAGEERDVI